jgi:hypothetical protein
LCLTFQRRGFQGNETDRIASSLLGPVPPSFPLLCPPFHVQKPQFFTQALPGGLRIR